MSSVVAYLLLGSNIGDRAAHLQQARQTLSGLAGEVLAASSRYETAAWGLEDQPAFLNQVELKFLSCKRPDPPDLRAFHIL